MLLRTAASALILLGGLIAIPAPVRAAESYDNCTGFITSLPATITTSGTWCMNQDLSTAMTSGAAIVIATNNVTLDCNDFKLGGLAAGAATQAYGIYALDRLNTTVRRCNIRGFHYGVFFGDTGFSGGHVIEDNRLDGNTYVGLFVAGDGSVVRRNLIHDTGGSTVDLGSAAGIWTVFAVDVLDNTVSGVLPLDGSAVGIYTQLNNGSISRNRVRGLVKMGNGVANAIDNAFSGRISLDGNHVIGDGNVGLRCNNDDSRAKNNIVNGFAAPIQFCRNDGNSL